MHVLFIIDPLPLLKAYKDSSVAMMQALQARGHTLSVALQGDLYIDAGEVRTRFAPIALRDGADLGMTGGAKPARPTRRRWRASTRW